METFFRDKKYKVSNIRTVSKIKGFLMIKYVLDDQEYLIPEIIFCLEDCNFQPNFISNQFIKIKLDVDRLLFNELNGCPITWRSFAEMKNIKWISADQYEKLKSFI